MPSDKPARRLLDIIENARAIAGYTQGMDAAAFQENTLVSDAVERCLERISEAVSKLGEQAADLLPGQPWQQIKAFGNVLRHDYGNVLKIRLWDVIQQDLPPLVRACDVALNRLREEQR